jgi:tRNA (mo5U34)-methyltransferase
MEWKNIVPRVDELKRVPPLDATFINGDVPTIAFDDITQEQKELLGEIAFNIRPWRKGPFQVADTFIDSEWRSFVKYNLLRPYFDLRGKDVADVGCNNGFYMFRMLEDEPRRLIGFDPAPLFKVQFDFINGFVKSDIQYELLGIEHLEFYKFKFDVIFCLGVLYHRSDPVSALKSLYKGIKKKGGELILDTFMIDGDEEIALTPKGRYSKIPNVYFIPTIPALKNWLSRAGFVDIEVLATSKTDTDEQRQTQWIISESLGEFLDENDDTRTVEGYPAPKRVYIKAYRR